MQALRRTISGAAAACVAVTAALVIASAPAASSWQDGRLLVTSAAARRYAGAVERTNGAWPRRDALAEDITAKGAMLAIRPTSLATASSGRIRVVIETSNPALARESVRALGGQVERTAAGLVQALVTPRAETALAGKAGVDRVRPPYAQIQTAVSGEEVGGALAAAWHEKGFTGKGVKVAVIDGGFKGLADRQASGDLPANVVTQDFCGGQLLGAEDHGTAVAEIVHEMAPDAQLYLACVGTEVDLAAAEAWAKSQGVTVINHSAGWEGPYRDDGGGPVGAVVADARASGILWVNSAGNEAMTHWSGSYTPSGSWEMWSPNGDLGNSFIWPNGMEICGFLKWDEWPSGISDFDLGLFLSGSNSLLAISEGDQGSGQPPFEAMCWQQTSGRDLVVFWAIRGYRVATSPRLDLVSWSLPLQYSVASGSIASPASSPAALAVGALCWQSRALEPYSSQGPTIDGRTKPDIVGHDSVSGATYGGFSSCPSAFAGTSASSPEVAGAAALVKQVYPNLTPDQLKAYLMRATRDLGDAGVDNVYGAGELQLPKPPDIVAPTATALASTGRSGKMLRLLAKVSDDSGEVSIVEQIKLGRRMIATIKRGGFVSAATAKTVATVWKAPKKVAGSYQHCVRVTDRTGNASPLSCAKVVLK
jgi:subtilisin family serine protease